MSVNVDNQLTRRRIDAILNEMLLLTRELRARGIDTNQHEDKEAMAIVKRIVMATVEKGCKE